MIRPATQADAARVADLWNGVITGSLATFRSTPMTVPEVAGLIAARPVFLVADQGFVTLTQFRGGDGYRHTAEHTIIVDPAARGQGLGRAPLA